MTDTGKSPVERAKARMEQWQAQYQEFRSQPTYFHLPPLELVRLAESSKPLAPEQLEALDAAWMRAFGEPLCGRHAEGADQGSGIPESAAQVVVEGQGEDANGEGDEGILGWKAAARFAGVSVSTLQRLVVDKKFPGPLKVSARRRGWSREELEEWREKLTSTRDRVSDRKR